MSHASELRKITCPVFFRLLYSSGIRTTEARLLTRRGVDFGHGVLDIQKSKGYDQHYVALHQSMTELLGRYDRAADRLCPGQDIFFESPEGQPYSRAWVSYNFSLLWEKANGKKGNTVAYDFRHNYATANINSWKDDTFEFNDRLHYLARSMGHRCTESTLYYYSVVPRLADMIQEKQRKVSTALYRRWLMKKNKREAARMAGYISEFLHDYAPQFLTSSEHTLKSYRDALTLYIVFLEKKASRMTALEGTASRGTSSRNGLSG